MIKVINILEEGRMGGPQIRVLRVTPHLRDEDIDTLIIVPSNNSKVIQQALKEKCLKFELIYLTALQRNFFVLLKYIFLFPYEIIILVRLFLKKKPDLIHVSGGAWQIKGLLAAKLLNIPVIWNLNDTSQPWMIYRLFQLLKHLADAFIVAGARVHSYYLGNKPNKSVFVIPPPVDFSKFDPKLFSANYNTSVKRVLSVANISPVKDIETLVLTAKILCEQNERIEFRVVGKKLKSQTNYLRKIEHLIEKYNLKNFTLIGSSEDIAAEIAQANVFVCSSIFEAGPLTVLEAMAMGKPIVSTDVGDVSLYIENKKSGFVVPTRDARQIAECVEYFLKNTNEAQKMGQLARKVAKKNFDVCVIARLHAEAYSSLIKQKEHESHSWS